MPRNMTDATIHKTFKLYIDGAFPRSESGRTSAIHDPRKKSNGVPLAQVARASRKDLRNAVQGARGAFEGWAGAPAFLRGQILYRMAEMLDHRASSFADALVRYHGATRAAAMREAEASATRLLFYAGCCDKLAQLLGTVNPVVGPYFNFSMPEPTGVVAALPPRMPPLLGLVSCVAPLLVPGNTVVAVVEVEAAPIALDFAEVVATSDVPKGVLQILTGDRAELVPHVATHRDLDGTLLVTDDETERLLVESEASDHVKRGRTIDVGTPARWHADSSRGIEWIEPFVEIKTAWHSMGR
ncbi:MAG: aldehyde dehydrogenase family protein [Planctomycetes bacterium]|nr:aldehyde dehydrogenase family protein [Planctomycetota bacterium]MCB9918483.1 aldehyde dehydrogenase family protein [Planctomycetota bacterium]